MHPTSMMNVFIQVRNKARNAMQSELELTSFCHRQESTQISASAAL